MVAKSSLLYWWASHGNTLKQRILRQNLITRILSKGNVRGKGFVEQLLFGQLIDRVLDTVTYVFKSIKDA